MEGPLEGPVMDRARLLAEVATLRRRLGQRVGNDNHRSTEELRRVVERLRRKA